jgi:AGZA family xanthine/uracil permease-like MFS transporter
MPSPPSQRYADVVGGLTTFVTMAYIVVVNPAILSDGTGVPFTGALTATVLVSAAMTLLMGLYARLPFAVAPGMGLNAFFAYTIVLQEGVPWPAALGMVFWSGVLFLLISVTRAREAIATAIPRSLRLATAGGIGLLLAFLGFRNAGLIEADPATLVRLGTLDHRAAFLLAGLALAAVLMRRRNPLAFLVSIAATAAAAWGLGYADAPAAVVGDPDFTSMIFALDLGGALQVALLPVVVTLLFTDLFDSLSTFIGVSTASGLTEADGQPLRLGRGLTVDAAATMLSGLVGTSPGTTFVESIAGIRMGARTGLASVVTAACFVPCLFLAPLVAAIPAYATAGVLVLVGVAMFQPVTGLTLDRVEEALPPFVTLLLIPLTFSITQGILWGFLLHAVLFAAVGRAREVTPMLWGLAALSAVLLVI